MERRNTFAGNHLPTPKQYESGSESDLPKLKRTATEKKLNDTFWMDQAQWLMKETRFSKVMWSKHHTENKEIFWENKTLQAENKSLIKQVEDLQEVVLWLEQENLNR